MNIGIAKVDSANMFNVLILKDIKIIINICQYVGETWCYFWPYLLFNKNSDNNDPEFNYRDTFMSISEHYVKSLPKHKTLGSRVMTKICNDICAIDKDMAIIITSFFQTVAQRHGYFFGDVLDRALWYPTRACIIGAEKLHFNFAICIDSKLTKSEMNREVVGHLNDIRFNVVQCCNENSINVNNDNILWTLVDHFQCASFDNFPSWQYTKMDTTTKMTQIGNMVITCIFYTNTTSIKTLLHLGSVFANQNTAILLEPPAVQSLLLMPPSTIFPLAQRFRSKILITEFASYSIGVQELRLSNAFIQLAYLHWFELKAIYDILPTSLQLAQVNLPLLQFDGLHNMGRLFSQTNTPWRRFTYYYDVRYNVVLQTCAIKVILSCIVGIVLDV